MTTHARLARGAALALALIPSLSRDAAAQSYFDSAGTLVPGVVLLSGCTGGGKCVGPVSASNPLPVSATVNASISGFAPTPAYVTATAPSGSSSAATLAPASSTVDIVYNTGSYPVSVRFGNGSVAATATNDIVQPNSWLAFTPGASTYFAVYGIGGSSSVVVSGGSGLPTGAGGGGGSGGASVPTGSAGSPNASVVTVQGISGATALKVDGSAVTQPVSGTLTANAGTNLNTSALALESGGNLASVASNTARTGAGSSAATALPVQGVTGGVALPVSLGSLPALASGSNTIGAVTQSGTWNINNVSGTVSLPTGAATAANQTGGAQKTQIVDGSGNVIASTSNNLNVQCANCSGSGVSTGDNATFTAGSSLFAGIGGEYATGLSALTTGHQAMAALTPYRALQTDWYNAAGAEMGTAGNPVQVSLANTGANATAVKVDGSGVTQPVSGTFWQVTQPVSLASLPALANGANTIGAVSQNGTWNINNVSGTVSLPTGAATSANQTTEITSLGTIATNTGAGATAANQTSVIGSKAPGTAAASSMLGGGVYTSAGVSLTNGQQAALQLDSTGHLLTTASLSGSTSNASSGVATSSANVPGVSWLYGFNGTTWDQLQVDASKYLKVNVETGNTAQLGGHTIDLGSGTGGSGTQRVIIDSSQFNGNVSSNAQTAGTPVVPVSQTAGGVTPKRLSALSTTVTAIKSSAGGQLIMLQCGNTNTSEEYVQVFDVATAGGVTLGTTTPTLSIPVAASNTGGLAISTIGIQFANGIQVAATTTATGSSAPATALDCNAAYN